MMDKIRLGISVGDTIYVYGLGETKALYVGNSGVYVNFGKLLVIPHGKYRKINGGLENDKH